MGWVGMLVIPLLCGYSVGLPKDWGNQAANCSVGMTLLQEDDSVISRASSLMKVQSPVIEGWA